ncbi:MAG: ABC transporter permease, partial [Caldilineaceae bacterium]
MSSLTRIFRYLRAYKWYVFFMFVTTVLPVIMELLVPRLLQLLIDHGIRAQDMAAIWRYSGIMLLTALLGSVATLGQGVCRAQISQGVAFDMRNDLFRHIQALSWRDLDELQTGQLMTRISSDVDVVRMFSSAGLALLLRALLMIVGSVVMMALLDLRLTSIIVVMLVISFIAIGGIMRLARPKFTLVQQKLAALNTIVQENLAGVRVVKAYAREAYEIARFRTGNQDLRDENIDVGRLMSTVIPILFLLTNLGSVAVIWWGGWDTVGGRLTVGELIAFNNYLLIGMAPLLLLGNILMMVSRAEASAERVLEVLDTEPSIQPAAAPHRADAIAGRVVFDNVTFRYDGQSPAPTHGSDATVASNGHNGATGTRRRQEDVLHNVSF